MTLATSYDQKSPADETFMRRALHQAYLALSTPGAGEVGCVIVKDGEIVAEAFNEGELRSDPTAHAEMVAIRKLAAKWKTVDLRDATLSLHPERREQHLL